MKANVFSHADLIGTADLNIGDRAMGGCYGVFTPTALYFEKIQPAVWKFWQQQNVNYKEWHALRFNVQLENGIFLFPQGGYTFDDIAELPNEPIQINIAGFDYESIENVLKPAIEAPWVELSISQKIAFEDELRKELGIGNKSFFGFRRKPLKHALSDAACSAYCCHQGNDDVLFEISKPNSDKRLALAHLTWTGKKERENYPQTVLYSDLQAFKNDTAFDI